MHWSLTILRNKLVKIGAASEEYQRVSSKRVEPGELMPDSRHITDLRLNWEGPAPFPSPAKRGRVVVQPVMVSGS